MSQVALYVSNERLHGRVQRTAFNYEGVQHYLKCNNHPDRHLLRANPDNNFKCSKLSRGTACKNRLHLICDQENCTIGLCKHHTKLLLGRNEIFFVNTEAIIDETEPPLERTDYIQEAANEEHIELAEGGLNLENDAIGTLFTGIVENIDPVPATTNITDAPTYKTNNKDEMDNYLPSHLLFNNTLSRPSTIRSRFCKAPLRHQQWMQKLYSDNPDDPLPLLFPEAQLHPNIFWCEHEGSPMGALPSVMYSKYGNQKKIGGLATIEDHAIVRMKDFMLPTSRDNNYIAATFDAKLNSHFDNNQPLKIARKGLHTLNKLVGEKNKELPIKTQHAESKYETKKLAASFKDVAPWDYFLTLTCNTELTPGVAPITEAIKHGSYIEDANVQELIQNAMVIILRSWYRFAEHFFNYLKNSHEMPLGKITSLWYRFEWQSQTSAGNLPHIHGGITLDKTNETEQNIISRIKNRPEAFWTDEDHTSYDEALRRGLVENFDDYIQQKLNIEKWSQHDCKNSQYRCKKRTGPDGKTYCRVPLHPNNFWNTIHEKEDLFSEETLGIMREGGIDTNDMPSQLRAHSFNYANTGYRRGIPIIPYLSLIVKSSTNVQRCDSRFCLAYVVKYASATDEKRDIIIEQSKENENMVTISHKELFNEKINAARYAHNREKNKEQSTDPVAKEIGFTEMIWFILNLDYIKNDFKYIYVNCNSSEQRSALLKNKNVVYKKNKEENGQMRTTSIRNNAVPWRKFSATSEVHIQETVECCYLLDSTTAFNIRPPELITIDNLHDYAQWFDVGDLIKVQYDDEIDTHPLTDGIGNTIKVREKYLPKLAEHFTNLHAQLEEPNSAEETIHNDMIATMHTLYTSLMHERENKTENEPYSERYRRFVNHNETQHVVIVFSDVGPDVPDKFLKHFVLRHGNYKDEYELFSEGNLLTAYEKAGLITDKNNITRQDYKNILHKYIINELAEMPITARKMESNLRNAKDTISRFLLNQEEALLPNPYILDVNIQAASINNLEAKEHERRLKLSEAVQAFNFPGCPSPQDIMNNDADAINFRPTLQQQTNQSDESFEEQNRALNICTNTIDSHGDIDSGYIPPVILEGPPGSGKTYLMMLALTYALCQQKRVCVTSLTAHRSRALGCEHMHHLFEMPVENNIIADIRNYTENILHRLAEKPIKAGFLKRLQIIFFEEIGLISQEQLAIIDAVLRRIKNIEKPFGGCILFATGDHQQLKPINGNYIWMSSYFVTNINVLKLENFVRSAQDPDLQTIIKTMRKEDLHHRQIKAVTNIIERRCKTNRVENFENLNDDVLTLVSKRAAAREIKEKFLERKMSENGATYFTSEAIDEVRLQGEPNWNPADAATKKQLDRVCLAPQILVLFPNTVMQLTYNNNRPQGGYPVFSQSQLMVITEIPDDNVQLVIGKLIPIGSQYRGIIDPNWEHIVLKKIASNEHIFNTRLPLKARRIQYPLQYHLCQTIHKCMGDTLDKIATKLSTKDSKYSIWEKAQLLVVVSRVRTLDNLIFVGNWNENMKAVTKILKKENKDKKSIAIRLNNLNKLTNPVAIVIPPERSLRGIGSGVPAEKCGFVYMFISRHNQSRFLIGDGHCLQTELNFLNSAAADIQNHYWRPYLPAFYITGFPKNDGMHEENIEARRTLRAQLDQCILLDREIARDRGQQYTWVNIIPTAERFVQTYRDDKYPDMVLVLNIALQRTD